MLGPAFNVPFARDFNAAQPPAWELPDMASARVSIDSLATCASVIDWWLPAESIMPVEALLPPPAFLSALSRLGIDDYQA